MRYIVDGYNVTMADDATRRLSREEQREALVARLAVRGADLLGPGTLEVVFDGRHGHAGAARRGNVEVRFSREETADDLIVRLAASTKGSLTVVTSDRELRARVEAAASGGVRFLGCSALFEERKARKSKRFPASTAGLPPGANRITEELKRIWLDEEEES